MLSNVVQVVLLVAPKKSGKTMYAAALARMALRGYSVLGGWRLRCAERWIVENSLEKYPSRHPDISNTIVQDYHDKVISGQPNVTDKVNFFFYEVFHEDSPDGVHPLVVADIPGGWILSGPEPDGHQQINMSLRMIYDHALNQANKVWESGKSANSIVINISMIIFWNSSLDNYRQIDRFPILTSEKLGRYLSESDNIPIHKKILYYTAADYLPGLQGPYFAKILQDWNKLNSSGAYYTMRHLASPGAWEFIRHIYAIFPSPSVGEDPCWAIRYGSSVGACPDGTPNWLPGIETGSSSGGGGTFKHVDVWHPLKVLEPLLICCGVPHVNQR